MHLVYGSHCFQFLLDITVVPREIEDNDEARRTSEANLLVVKDLILILKGLLLSVKKLRRVVARINWITKIMVRICKFNTISRLFPIVSVVTDGKERCRLKSWKKEGQFFQVVHRLILKVRSGKAEPLSALRCSGRSRNGAKSYDLLGFLDK